MTYKAEIDIMPLKTLLDPQGKAVSASMKNIGLSEIDDVRIGKHISLNIEADSREDAEESVTKACQKLLANEIMESFEYSISKI